MANKSTLTPKEKERRRKEEENRFQGILGGQRNIIARPQAQHTENQQHDYAAVSLPLSVLRRPDQRAQQFAPAVLRLPTL